MLRVIEHHPAFSWPEGSAADSLTLDFDNRHRRRIRLTTNSGAHVLLDLPKAVAMAHGDGLRLEDGSWLRVNAAPETLVEVLAADATQLTRIAWHIGNRHLPAQIMPGAIRIRPDHVIEAMLIGLGGVVTRVDAPFQPEGGAYGGQAMHGQAHSHDHGHSHGHGNEARHLHDLAHTHNHAQGDEPHHPGDHPHSQTHGQDDDARHPHDIAQDHDVTGPHTHSHEH